MKILEPEDYSLFHCAASECPDTCCAAWEVIIDEKAKSFYDQMPGDLGICVREAMVKREDGWMFRTKNGRCPLLTYDALCSIQLKFGEEGLCRTCREYPGFVSEYGLYRERGHSLSCPEAARMLCERAEPMRFVSYETEEALNGCNSIDADLFYRLRQAREVALSIAQNRNYPVQRRIHLLMQFAEALQLCIDEGRRDDMEAVCKRFCVQRPIISRRASDYALRRTMIQWTRFFTRLEVLRPEWNELLTDLLHALEKQGRRQSVFMLRQNTVAQEQILVYYVYKFFLRSAYCADVLVKTKLIAVCCMMIDMLDWLTHPKEPWQNAYRFARELEHSEENLEALERWLKKSWRFSTQRILSAFN